MPGLPFVSLADAIPGAERDYLGNAQYQHVKQNERELDVERAMGRPWIEPMWDLSAQGQPSEQDLDPFNLLDKQHETVLSQLAPQFEAAEQRIAGSIQNDLDVGLAKYKLDRDALEASDLDPEQKRRRSMELNTQYQKHGVDLRGKIKPDLDSLAAKRQEALAQLSTTREQKRIELQTIQTVGKKYGWGDKDILREQYQALGVAIPQALLAEPKQLTPRQRLQELDPILRDWEAEKDLYRRKPSGKDWLGRAQPTSRIWQEYDFDTKTYFDVPEKTEYINDLESRVQTLRPQVDELQRQIAGSVRRGPSLESTTRSPLAQSVVAQKPSYVGTWGVIPATRQTGAKTLTRDQAAALVRETGGDKDKARQLARERGYSF